MTAIMSPWNWETATELDDEGNQLTADYPPVVDAIVPGQLCGKWMPKSGRTCGKRLGHPGHCKASKTCGRDYDVSRYDPAIRAEPTVRHPDFTWAGIGEWARRGICYGADPDIWFDEGCNYHHTLGEPGWRDCRVGEAKAICGNCPVRTECLKYAIDAGEQYGIWGGLTPKEREAIKRRSAIRLTA